MEKEGQVWMRAGLHLHPGGHTFFEVGGLVCDSRGCTLGPAEQVLGKGWKEAFGKKAPAPFAAAALLARFVALPRDEQAD